MGKYNFLTFGYISFSYMTYSTYSICGVSRPFRGCDLIICIKSMQWLILFSATSDGTEASLDNEVGNENSMSFELEICLASEECKARERKECKSGRHRMLRQSCVDVRATLLPRCPNILKSLHQDPKTTF